MHIPVLATEVLEAFKTRSIKVFIDATLGAGGHSSLLLSAHNEIEHLIGIDQDPIALETAQKKLKNWEDKIHLTKGNFVKIKEYLRKLHLEAADGILIDLGVSSMQLDQPEKGFSFMRDGPLDMRMSPENPLTAEEIINNWSEEELGRIFREYGEEKQWRKAAKEIVYARKKTPIKTTHQLVEILRPSFSWKKKGINPLTLIFQALRIQVNEELDVLKKVILEAIEILSQGGRLVIISFHSLEDRIVKNAFRFAASDKYDTSGLAGVFIDKKPSAKLITNRPIIASEEEVRQNPRSRSAKLRILEKI